MYGWICHEGIRETQTRTAANSVKKIRKPHIELAVNRHIKEIVSVFLLLIIELRCKEYRELNDSPYVIRGRRYIHAHFDRSPGYREVRVVFIQSSLHSGLGVPSQRVKVY